MEKTVKEIADELGVSKQRVMYHVKKLSTKEYQKKDNTIYINEVGQRAIKSKFEDLTDDKQTDKKNENLVDKEYINTLKEQLNKKDIQLEKAQKLLDQQQQLTLQANKQIEKLQEQLQLTYTEEAPENDSTTLSEATETIDKQIDTEKKWWQLWK